MSLARLLKWTAALLLAPLLAAVLFIAIFGWNWLRAPIERAALAQTGRELRIEGDIDVSLGWPAPRLRAGAVRFANPSWAVSQQMLSTEAVDLRIDLPQLLRGNIVVPEVVLLRPRVFLEQGSGGRKSWLMDREQQDEGAVIQIGRLRLDQGTLGYDDAAAKTSLRAELSTLAALPGGLAEPGVGFSVRGRYLDLAVKAEGSAGPVLALRFDGEPYALKIDGSVGRTGVRAEGSITSLLKFSAVDLRLGLRGDSLDQLFPLLGIALPATRAYAIEGRLLHGGKRWRYQNLAGRIGQSDIAGSLQIDGGAARPALSAELDSRLLDLADLGPLIGARPDKLALARQAAPLPAQGTAVTPRAARLLPDLPFKTERWNSVDAEVTLRAKTLRHAQGLPLEGLQLHLSLRDSVLRLDPLSFGLAGGQLKAQISLDGRQQPIQARAQLKALKIQLGQLMPRVDLRQTGIGQINGEFDLSGSGGSVARMLASANGRVALVVAGGRISRLTMEKAGLHLWEILEIKLAGDRLVKLRCAVADFEARQGVLHTDALVFDTEITTLIGSGSIDLGQERFDLSFNQKTKATSPLALRSPILLRGSFAQPTLGVDKGGVAARALGAVALGAVNPFLTLLPLIDAGPGQDSDCGQLVREARSAPTAPKIAGAPK